MMQNKPSTILFKVLSFRKKPKGDSEDQIRSKKSEEKKTDDEEDREEKEQVRQEKKDKKVKKKKDMRENKNEESDDDKSDVGKVRSGSFDNKSEHKLPTVGYSSWKQKYKGYHSREYGVNYNKDVEAYHYRGYDIKAPEVSFDVQEVESLKETTRWIQYMSHAERQKLKYPFRMHYTPEDNSFVQLVLILVFLSMLFTLLCNILCKYVKYFRKGIVWYPVIWVPGCFGVVFTVYIVLCSACSRKFPLNYIMLVINVFSMTYMCCYVTVIHNTYGVVFATSCIAIIVLIFLLMALCDVDFTRFAILCLGILLGIFVPYFFYFLLGKVAVTREWVPPLKRHYNMMILGIASYSSSMILMLQLIIQNRTILLSHEDYATGTFIVYMCEICMFMKLISYLGLFEENRR